MTLPESTSIFHRLYDVLQKRKTADPNSSYVAKLYSQGRDRILQKVGEEATEVILAAKNKNRQEIINETADLWFHTLVMLADQNIHPEEVLSELEQRVGIPSKAAPPIGFDRREHSRLPYQKNIILRLNNGLIIEGTATDVSLNGMQVACSYEPKWQLLWETGFFELQTESRVYSFSFEISRVTDDCVGINITSDRGSFSFALAQGVFKDMFYGSDSSPADEPSLGS